MIWSIAQAASPVLSGCCVVSLPRIDGQDGRGAQEMSHKDYDELLHPGGDEQLQSVILAL